MVYRKWIRACFAAVVILFFFTFCGFTATMGSRGSRPVKAVQAVPGINFIMGMELSRPGDMDNAQAAGFFVPDEKIRPDIWAILALAAASAGLFVFAKNGERESLYNAGLSLAGFITLLLLQVSAGKYVESLEIPGLYIQLSFHLAYWAALSAFALAGCLSYLQFKRQSHVTGVVKETNTVTPIHISIITQHNSVNEWE
jgi:hypothetical protein